MVILLINVIIVLFILNNMVLKEKAGLDFVAASIPFVPATVIGNPCGIAHTCGFNEWAYNPKEEGGFITKPPDVNVFVREEKVWMMGEKCDLVPIRVKIEIW